MDRTKQKQMGLKPNRPTNINARQPNIRDRSRVEIHRQRDTRVRTPHETWTPRAEESPNAGTRVTHPPLLSSPPERHRFNSSPEIRPETSYRRKTHQTTTSLQRQRSPPAKKISAIIKSFKRQFQSQIGETLFSTIFRWNPPLTTVLKVSGFISFIAPTHTGSRPDHAYKTHTPSTPSPLPAIAFLSFTSFFTTRYVAPNREKGRTTKAGGARLNKPPFPGVKDRRWRAMKASSSRSLWTSTNAIPHTLKTISNLMDSNYSYCTKKKSTFLYLVYKWKLYAFQVFVHNDEYKTELIWFCIFLSTLDFYVNGLSTYECSFQ